MSMSGRKLDLCLFHTKSKLRMFQPRASSTVKTFIENKLLYNIIAYKISLNLRFYFINILFINK